MKLIKRIWEKEWVKIMIPIYGEIYIMNQPTGGHAYGYDKGFILLGISMAKYGIPALVISLIVIAYS